MLPLTDPASVLRWRKGSRAAGFEMCTSTFIPSNVSSASASAHDECVSAPALITMAARTTARCVHRLDEVALEVRLHVSHDESGVFGELAESLDVLGQCGRAVDLGIARTQQIEVRTRQQQNLVTHFSPRNLSSTSLTSCGSTSFTVSNPSAPASTKVRSWCAFLSCAIASKSDDVGKCSGMRRWRPK